MEFQEYVEQLSDKYQDVIQEAAKLLENGSEQYGDLAIIKASVDLKKEVNPEHVQLLSGLAYKARRKNL